MTADRPRAWNSTLPVRRNGLARTPFPVPLAEEGTPRFSSLTRNGGLGNPRLAVVVNDGAAVLAPAQWQRRRETVPREVRRLVLERDGYACVCCGRSIIGHRYSLGHRLRASQGGKAVPSNLLVFLGWGGEACHGRIDSRRDAHDEAKGYTVRSWQDPALIPVMVFSEHGSGITAWLTDEGTYRYDPPEGAA